MGWDGCALAPRDEKSASDGLIVSSVVYDARRDLFHVLVERVCRLILYVII